MKRLSQILFILSIALISCKDQKSFAPPGLTKATKAQMINNARNKVFPDKSYTQYFDTLGNSISYEEVLKMNPNNTFGDQYLDSDGKIAGMVIRNANSADKALIRELTNIINEYTPKIIEVDCSDLTNILYQVKDDDQRIRNEGPFDPEVDKRNQDIVVSILEKCGFPSQKEYGMEGPLAVFLVLQHANKELMAKYFPYLEAAEKSGDLEPNLMAMMRDRILMYDGEKQIYGTQITKVDGEWAIHPIFDPDNVDERRASVGLGPLAEYLSRWEIPWPPVN